MFEQTFKNIDDILFKDPGADSELDYIGQTSWVLFLRYLEDLEQDKADEAALQGKEYEYILEEKFRWPNWAMPKNEKGELDHHVAMTGPDLVQFVDHELFPYLSSFKEKSKDNPQSIEYKIGEIFSELKNKIQSGYNLREIIELADGLPFKSTKQKHELSHLYETKIKNMGNAGRNGGQYYTPRPLIRAMITVTDPQIGETVYDGAVGSAGFLVESFEYMYDRMEKSTANLKTLQEKTFFGKEKKNLAYVIGIMNMILHGIEAPNIIHTNTLGESIRDIQEKDRYNVILANPPFGGKERKEVQQNFDIKTGETAFLFLQHFIKSLKSGGRAAIVIKNTVLSNDDNASISLRKYLLESCNLHTILDLPKKTFSGAGVKTVVLFFTKGEKTKNIWYYKLDTGQNLGKTNPIKDKDFVEFLEMIKTRDDTKSSWSKSIADINTTTYDLSVINPVKPEKPILASPEIIQQDLVKSLDEEFKVIENLKQSIDETFDEINSIANKKRIGELCTVIAGQSPESKFYNDNSIGLPFYQGKKEFGIKHIKEPRVWTSKITKTAEAGDILMSVRAPVGPVNYSTQKICIGRGLAAIRPTKELNKDYLFYYFLHNEEEINGKEGAVFNSINKGQIEDLRIPLPSLEIQQKIVDRLDNIMKEIDAISSLILSRKNKLHDLKRSVTGKVFE